MRLLLLSIVFILTSQANAFEQCATQEVDTSEKFFVDLRTKLLSPSLRFMSTDEFKTRTVPVIVHIIEKQIPTSVIDEQMEILNDGYALTGFEFKLQNINFVNTAKWSRPDNFPMTRIEYDMKTQLRQGGSDTLNIYIVSNLNPQLGGWAYFPWQYRAQPELDGVVINMATLPSDRPNLLTGVTLTHEVGHWLGLLHTFQGGCTAQGDMIDDTPAQKEAIHGCARPIDTCPELPGLDPTDNFMGYSGNACMNKFTAGQVMRMTTAFDTFRKSISTLIN